MDDLWVQQNRHAVCESMIGLFQRLTGNKTNDILQIVSTIEEWTFQIKQTTQEEMGEHEASVLSMVNDGPTDSFIEIRKSIANEIGDRPRRKRKPKEKMVKSKENKRRRRSIMKKKGQLDDVGGH